MRELPHEALPTKSYTPIGQGGPLSPRPPRPKPLLSPKLDTPTPGTRQKKGVARDLSVNLVLEFA